MLPAKLSTRPLKNKQKPQFFKQTGAFFGQTAGINQSKCAKLFIGFQAVALA
jgi:hypothetical protein